MAPVMTVSFISLEAYSFARSMSPSPITLPSRMPPALAVPKQRTVPKFRTTTTRELAATASEPICPRMTEYMEKATLHARSLRRAGRESLIKS